MKCYRIEHGHFRTKAKQQESMEYCSQKFVFVFGGYESRTASFPTNTNVRMSDPPYSSAATYFGNSE